MIHLFMVARPRCECLGSVSHRSPFKLICRIMDEVGKLINKFPNIPEEVILTLVEFMESVNNSILAEKGNEKRPIHLKDIEVFLLESEGGRFVFSDGE